MNCNQLKRHFIISRNTFDCLLIFFKKCKFQFINADNQNNPWRNNNILLSRTVISQIEEETIENFVLSPGRGALE